VDDARRLACRGTVVAVAVLLSSCLTAAPATALARPEEPFGGAGVSPL
jgi:hypothetical protein